MGSEIIKFMTHTTPATDWSLLVEFSLVHGKRFPAITPLFDDLVIIFISISITAFVVTSETRDKAKLEGYGLCTT